MPASIRKVTISLTSGLLDYADRRASRTQVSRSQVIGQALAEAQAREQTGLAAEGYRFYAEESGEFADASAQAVAEVFTTDPNYTEIQPLTQVIHRRKIMNNPQLDIRIGTLVNGGPNTADYIRQILPHGFESFTITFWQTLGGTDLKKLAAEVREALAGSGAVISAVEIFGNPLEGEAKDIETLQGWEALIDHAHLFGTDIVAGFTGRVRGKPLPDSLPRFKEVFGPLAQRAADKGLRIAFENCPMGGNWQTGDWNIAHNPAAWELMFDAVPMDNLGLEWEPCHQMCELIDPMPQLRTWIKRMFHLHGKCATIRWDVIREYGISGPVQFAYHRTPGFGDLDWTNVISAARLGGFKGALDIEGWHDPVYRGELEMTGQVYGLNYLKRCRGGDFVPNPA